MNEQTNEYSIPNLMVPNKYKYLLLNFKKHIFSHHLLNCLFLKNIFIGV